MKTIFVGIDAGKKHWVCILDKDRNEVVPKFSIGNSAEEYAKLERVLTKDAKLCIEDTGSYSQPIAHYLVSRGYDLVTIDGLRSKRLRQYLKEGLKTDVVDCEVLALVRLLDGVVPATTKIPHARNALRPLVRLYCAHARRRSQIKQQLAAVLQKQFPELVNSFYKPTCDTVLGILRWTTAAMRRDEAGVADVLRKNDIQVKRITLRRALKHLNHTIGIPLLDDTSLRVLIEAYAAERAITDGLREQMAQELLKTPYGTLVLLPNINVISASVIVGEAGDITRFATAKKFVKYCGFRFTREQSGSMDSKRFHIVANDVRWVLSCVAHVMARNDPEMHAFAERLRKRGKKAIVIRFAVARKILVRVYHEMRKRQHYTIRDNLAALEGLKKAPAMTRAVAMMRATIPGEASGTIQSTTSTVATLLAVPALQTTSR